MEQENLISRVRQQGHEYILKGLGKLDPEERTRLLRQLAALDLDRLETFARLIGRGAADAEPFESLQPAPVHGLAQTDAEKQRESEIRRLGREALSQDRVAALTLAGGQATRLGHDGPKGTFPITPVLGKSLFHVLAEKILAARRRYECRMPWFVMTGPDNDGQTRQFFQRNDFFGLGEDTVHFFSQAVNPILDAYGHMLLEEKGRLLVGPDGHGGVFEALNSSGALDSTRRGGWDLLTCSQVDNPLVRPADERFLGCHIGDEAELSCKVVTKRAPEEKLGIAALRDGRPAVVEYTELPDEMSRERETGGDLRFRYGSIAAHVISTAFVERMIQKRLALPWHVARKQYRVLDEWGEQVQAPGEGCYKFERFIFDALRYASDCSFVEVDRNAEFAPVKNADGQDSPATARLLMQTVWAEWIASMGFHVRDSRGRPDRPIEISPLFAESPEELRDRLPQDWEPGKQIVLEP